VRIHPAPRPVPSNIVDAHWRELWTRPELVCTTSWSDACREWWTTSDVRLRTETLSSLHLREDELDAWQARALDEGTLARAQAHVTATRAGEEYDTSKRTLVTGFRDAPIVANHRDGSRTVYLDASEVPQQVAMLAATFDALPTHPIVRAVWLTQAVGAIHPFRDSNGGTSRFLSSIELSRAALPPFMLTKLLREGPYIAALMLANEHQMWPLIHIFYEATQQTLANILLCGVGRHASWTSHEEARTERWASSASAAWHRALGTVALARTMAPGVLARLARRRVRLPILPEPRCFEWHSSTPLPLQLDLVLVPVRGGNHTWLVGSIDASIGDGDLAAIVDGEQVPEYFIAPANEPDDIVDCRFARWSELRIAQCIRGLSRWL
jgi:hypothetical protein